MSSKIVVAAPFACHGAGDCVARGEKCRSRCNVCAVEFWWGLRPQPIPFSPSSSARPFPALPPNTRMHIRPPAHTPSRQTRLPTSAGNRWKGNLRSISLRGSPPLSMHSTTHPGTRSGPSDPSNPPWPASRRHGLPVIRIRGLTSALVHSTVGITCCYQQRGRTSSGSALTGNAGGALTRKQGAAAVTGVLVLF